MDGMICCNKQQCFNYSWRKWRIQFVTLSYALLIANSFEVFVPRSFTLSSNYNSQRDFQWASVVLLESRKAYRMLSCLCDAVAVTVATVATDAAAAVAISWLTGKNRILSQCHINTGQSKCRKRCVDFGMPGFGEDGKKHGTQVCDCFLPGV